MMKEMENTGNSTEWVNTVIALIATIIGAGFGLGIGVIVISRGIWAGLFVLLLTILGAVAGRFYAASE